MENEASIYQIYSLFFYSHLLVRQIAQSPVKLVLWPVRHRPKRSSDSSEPLQPYMGVNAGSTRIGYEVIEYSSSSSKHSLTFNYFIFYFYFFPFIEVIYCMYIEVNLPMMVDVVWHLFPLSKVSSSSLVNKKNYH